MLRILQDINENLLLLTKKQQEPFMNSLFCFNEILKDAVESNKKAFRSKILVEKPKMEEEKEEGNMDYLNLFPKLTTDDKSKKFFLRLLWKQNTIKVNTQILSLKTACDYKEVAEWVKKQTGLTVLQLLKAFIIEHSKKLLLNEKLTLLQVSLECGFSNHQHYSNVFKSMHQLMYPDDNKNNTPGKYRKNHTKKK